MNQFDRLAWKNKDKKTIDDVRALSHALGWSTDHPEIVAFRDRMIELQEYSCAYCRSPIENNTNGYRDLDHIVPKAGRGKNRTRMKSNEVKDRKVTIGYPHFMYEPMNLALACKLCNVAKGNFDPYVDRAKPISHHYPVEADFLSEICWYNPHFHAYHDHIAKTPDCNFIPKTKEGHYTVSACKLDNLVQKGKLFQARAAARVGRARNLEEALNQLSSDVQAGIYASDHAIKELEKVLGGVAARAKSLFTLWYESFIDRRDVLKIDKSEQAYSAVVVKLSEKGWLVGADKRSVRLRQKLA
ncbi:HNH endonuclease [Herbaspirillum huttiense]|uniref:HNH endonuclease signature motif containing protein n=2 Tax=Herbaspirillum huttiense TaxID=863372 RepID=A0AAJ2HCN6_9BURK|nr:HNH endonuclease signature motif containing protein [Herbaspirillum huttiense]MDR9837640.1 HNH endonuclease signature motif containing protein [Herbaspirillum huttiense]